MLQDNTTQIVNHAARHQNGGTDEISVAGLSGLLGDAQTPLAHNQLEATITDLDKYTQAEVGTLFTNHTAIAGAHHTKYTDAEAVTAAKTVKLDDFATPDDNTDLDFGTARHGLVPKGTNIGDFLRDDGTWAAVAGGGGDVVGPAGATDHAVARYDLATGKLIQDSVVIITDGGAVSGVTTLAASGAVTGSNLNVANWDTAYGWGDHAGLYELLGAVNTHAGLTTGIHGVGGSTIASVLDIANHAALDTGVHGAGASTLATVLDIATHTALPNAHHVAFVQGDADALYEVLGTMTTHETTYNHPNYDTAYGWGDHSSAGYAPIDAPTFTTSVTIPQTADDGTYTGIVTNDSGVLKYRTKAEILSDIGAEPAGSVTTHESTYNHANYNTAYGWGDHAGLYEVVGDRGIADDNLVEVDGPGAGAPVNGEYAKWTANGLEGRSAAESKTDLGFFTLDADVDHDQTTNYDANKHVDHTGVTLTAGTGLDGGGDISANRTFNVDVDGLDEISAALTDADTFIVDDGDSGATKKCLMSRLTTYIGAGDVSAGANITDHSIVRGDGGAKGVQDSGWIITDGDVMEAAGDLDMGDFDLTDVRGILAHDGTFNIQLPSSGTVYVKGTTAAAWYNSSWLYRESIVSQNAKVDEAVTNAYIKLDDLDADFWAGVKDGGGDIRITQSDGTTEVAREVVFCDTGTEKGEVHFDCTGISTSATTTWYIYYGNAAATDYAINAEFGAENVWDANYVFVGHVQADFLDSTSYSNDATNGGSDDALGKMGQGQDCVAANDDHIQVDTLATAFEDYTALTVSFWFNPDVDTDHKSLWSTAGNADSQPYVKFDVHATKAIYFEFSGASPFLYGVTDNNVFSLGSWSKFDWTGDASSNKMYIDGSQETLNYTAGNAGTAGTPDALGLTTDTRLTWGALRRGAVVKNEVDALFDELRLSDIVRSANWLSTMHNCQNDQGTFWSAGSQETELSSFTPAHLDIQNNLTVGVDATIGGKALFGDGGQGIYSQADTFLDLFADDAVRIGNSSAGAPTTYLAVEPDGDTFWEGSGSGLAFGCIEGMDETVTCTLEDTWYQVTFDTVGQSNMTTVNIANEEITILKTGVYEVTVTACFHSAASNDFELMVKKNGGTADLSPHLFQTTGVAAKVENVSGVCLVPLTASDTLELWVQCTDAVGKAAIFDHVNITCTQIGG